MKNVTPSELYAVFGGQCYSAGISLFGLNIGVHIGDCPLDR